MSRATNRAVEYVGAWAVYPWQDIPLFHKVDWDWQREPAHAVHKPVAAQAVFVSTDPISASLEVVVLYRALWRHGDHTFVFYVAKDDEQRTDRALMHLYLATVFITMVKTYTAASRRA